MHPHCRQRTPQSRTSNRISLPNRDSFITALRAIEQDHSCYKFGKKNVIKQGPGAYGDDEETKEEEDRTVTR
jgi:hypothetical protein